MQFSFANERERGSFGSNDLRKLYLSFFFNFKPFFHKIRQKLRAEISTNSTHLQGLFLFDITVEGNLLPWTENLKFCDKLHATFSHKFHSVSSEIRCSDGNYLDHCKRFACSKTNFHCFSFISVSPPNTTKMFIFNFVAETEQILSCSTLPLQIIENDAPSYETETLSTTILHRCLQFIVQKWSRYMWLDFFRPQN